jgi:Flp pilus assembly protein TadD
MARRCLLLFLFSFVITPALSARHQQPQDYANIIGQLRVARGDFPAHQIMIELLFRGSAINTIYADTEGKFGFQGLVGGEYHVIIKDPGYEPVDERLLVRPDISVNVMAFITLRPRESARVVEAAGGRATGSNPNLFDLREYNRRFPKKAVREYDKAISAEADGKPEQAISHYQAALQIAPDYYPAHNNLGSEYLSKSDFPAARKEFEEVVRLNQSDAAGYFNLSNVCMLMGQMAEAEKYLGEGMRRQPDSALGHFLSGSLDMRQGKFQEAESVLREAIQLDPAMPQARLQLVNLYMQQGRRNDAVSELQSFLKTFPGAPAASKAKELLHKLQNPVTESKR